MSPTSASTLIRQAFEEVVNQVPAAALDASGDALAIPLPDLPALLRGVVPAPIPRGDLWLAVMGALRADQQAIYGPVVLEALAPGIVAALRALTPRPPAVTREDLDQQFLLQVLHNARAMSLPRHPDLIPKALLWRTTSDVGRWLAADANRRNAEELFTLGATRRPRAPRARGADMTPQRSDSAPSPQRPAPQHRPRARRHILSAVWAPRRGNKVAR